MDEARSLRMRLIAAFAAVYVIWGSTYLAILFAIETLPPFLMAGVRFLIAGALLYGWMRLRGAPRPSGVHWRSATIVGGLLLLGGNGAVVWAEQWVPSGVAALLVATVAFWMVLLEWLRPGGVRPTGAVVLGLVVGFAGLALLVSGAGEGERVHLLGAAALLFGTVCWAAGSIYARAAPLPASPFTATGMEMLAGGGLLVLVGVLTGELGRFDVGAVSMRSLLAFGYLVVFGSLVGFTAYIWLLGVTTPARAATYAYVNPIVAVLLGWAFAGEAFTPRMALAVGVIVGAVALIVTVRTRPARPELAVVPGDGAALQAATAPAPRRAWRRRRIAS
jgi:drug/metabolite transporter (DMT)-like permease